MVSLLRLDRVQVSAEFQQQLSASKVGWIKGLVTIVSRCQIMQTIIGLITLEILLNFEASSSGNCF